MLAFADLFSMSESTEASCKKRGPDVKEDAVCEKLMTR